MSGVLGVDAVMRQDDTGEVDGVPWGFCSEGFLHRVDQVQVEEQGPVVDTGESRSEPPVVTLLLVLLSAAARSEAAEAIRLPLPLQRSRERDCQRPTTCVRKNLLAGGIVG